MSNKVAGWVDAQFEGLLHLLMYGLKGDEFISALTYGQDKIKYFNKSSAFSSHKQTRH